MIKVAKKMGGVYLSLDIPLDNDKGSMLVNKFIPYPEARQLILDLQWAYGNFPPRDDTLKGLVPPKDTEA